MSKQAQEYIYINYPISKEKQQLQIGDNIIDFVEGKVYFPDGTEDYLSAKLSGTEYDAIRSIYIDTTAKIKVTFDDRDSQWILSRFQSQGTRIKRITVNVSSITSIAISASTNPYYSLYKAVGIDIQTRYQEKSTRTITSINPNTDYYLPASGSINVTTFGKNSFLIYADAGVDVVVETSVDDGVTFRELAGYSIDSDEFMVNKVNSIVIYADLEYIRLKVTTNSNVPSIIELTNIRKS